MSRKEEKSIKGAVLGPGARKKKYIKGKGQVEGCGGRIRRECR